MTTEPERWTNHQCPQCKRYTLTRNIGIDGKTYIRCVAVKCGYVGNDDKPKQAYTRGERIL